MVQLLQNLVGNALKFRGGEPLVIRLSASDEGHGWRVSVADNGIGIPSRHFERIFVMFQRLHGREQVRGQRHWPGHLQADRGRLRRVDRGEVQARRGIRIQLYLAQVRERKGAGLALPFLPSALALGHGSHAAKAGLYQALARAAPCPAIQAAPTERDPAQLRPAGQEAPPHQPRRLLQSGEAWSTSDWHAPIRFGSCRCENSPLRSASSSWVICCSPRSSFTRRPSAIRGSAGEGTLSCGIRIEVREERVPAMPATLVHVLLIHTHTNSYIV